MIALRIRCSFYWAPDVGGLPLYDCTVKLAFGEQKKKKKKKERNNTNQQLLGISFRCGNVSQSSLEFTCDIIKSERKTKSSRAISRGARSAQCVCVRMSPTEIINSITLSFVVIGSHSRGLWFGRVVLKCISKQNIYIRKGNETHQWISIYVTVNRQVRGSNALRYYYNSFVTLLLELLFRIIVGCSRFFFF